MKRWLLVAMMVVAVAVAGSVVLLVSARPSGQDAAASGVDLPGIYTRYQGRIYMNIPGEGYFLVPDADAGTFGMLAGFDSRNLGKDRHAVFCGSQVIAQLRPEQVRLVSHGYVSDGTRAWYCTSDKPNPSYRWWQFFTRSQDEDSPHKPRRNDYELVPLRSVNGATLHVVVEAYAEDGAHAYYEGRLIPDADGVSLRTAALGWGELAGRTDESYARDDRHVYFEGTPLPGAHPESFRVLQPDSDQWRNLYGQDGLTGQFYAGAQPFPASVDGVDSSALHLLIADRDRSNHELFYNASGIWYWDYQDDALKRGCVNPFDVAPDTLAAGVWADNGNTFVIRAVEDWGQSRGDRSLHARKTQLWMLPGVARSQWKRVADLQGAGGQARGTLWQAESQLYFAPASGQNVFLNDALYVVRDRDGLERDVVSDQYYRKIREAKDIERFDSSTATIVCRATSRY